MVMKSGCPTVSSPAWQIGLFGRAHEVPAATGCPIAVEQAAQIQALPQRGAQQREEAGEAVAPLAQERTEAQQQIHQQRGPNLPSHGVGVVSEEVRQLERLLQFLEEDFDAPTTAIRSAMVCALQVRLLVRNTSSRNSPSTSTRATTRRNSPDRPGGTVHWSVESSRHGGCDHSAPTAICAAPDRADCLWRG